jgi:hypothetical protein
MWKRLLPVCLSLLLLAIAGADKGAQAIDLDAFAKQPGVEVTSRIVGDKKVTSYAKAGVVYEKWPDYIVSIDQTGLGAVLCAWTIYVDVMLAAEACFPDSHAEIRKHLVEGVDAMNDFIVANNPDPVKKADLENQIAKRRAEKFSRLPASVIGTQQCPLSDFVRNFEKGTPEEWRASISKMLSVPRPPVMNPCL